MSNNLGLQKLFMTHIKREKIGTIRMSISGLMIESSEKLWTF